MSVTAEKCLLLSAQMHSGLCTLIGIREKPGGREKANRGRKRERKRRRKGREKKKKKKVNQASTAARSWQYKISPPQGVAILKGHFTIHQITKKTVALWVFLATGRPVGPPGCRVTTSNV